MEEIRRISDKIYALIDSELPSASDILSDDRKGFRQVCQQLGIDCHILKKRAIENYLTDRAVKVIVGPQYRGLTDFEKLQPSVHGWSKSDNWKISREMTREEVSATEVAELFRKLDA